MTKASPAELGGLVLYEVFVRNHGEGGLAAVTADLPRIRSMGVDVVWLMPIHPVGVVGRKGSLGSPYAISDYLAINPELGGEGDLRELLERAHGLGLKVMIDVVYNHTARDSRLMREHPEFYHRDEQGRPVSMVPEWSDAIDFDFPNPDLERYLIDALLRWSRLGVDGFRCDVAPRVPIEFWKRARAEIAAEKPQTLWLAESEHATSVLARRRAGLRAHSDCELYSAFDLTYDYDIWPAFQAAVSGKIPVAGYLALLRLQESTIPSGSVKLRCVENHDQRRVMALAPTRELALAWTAFEAFAKGAFLIYAGQESGARHAPSLFDRDPIEWGGYELQGFLTRLARLKKEPAVAEGRFRVVEAEPAVVATWESNDGCLLGSFNLGGVEGRVGVGIPDGDHEDLLGGPTVCVRGGEAAVPPTAFVVRYASPVGRSWFYSDLIDYGVAANEE